jgi:TonB-linked SusC/RagA family outer membrane protein
MMKQLSHVATLSGKQAIRRSGFKYFLLLPLLAFMLHAPLMAQDTKGDPVAVKELFKTIQEKSGYRFFYSDDMVDLNKKIVLEANEKDIQAVIDELKAKTSLDFKMLENQLIVVVPTGADKQSIVVKGKVTTPDDPMGLPGVNVFVKGTTIGTITDINGEYTLQVDNKYDVLVYSFIGFNNQEIPINAQNAINVELASNMQALDEIVVTALNIERDKSSLGYSVTQVGSDQINQAKENNPINSLAGKVAGLQITKAPTGVDGSSRVILRGVASLLGNNRPLFVIDGIPMDAGHGGGNRWGGTDSGDALSDLNPDDIESMSVLKGAGAAAAYGSRGANGVILITTKKGKNRKGIGVTFSSGYTIETPMVKPDLQNDYAQGSFGEYPINAGVRNDHPWIWSFGPKIEGQELTNWLGETEQLSKQPHPYDEFFRTGSTFTNTVAFNGGNEEASFRASITNQDSKGLLPNNNLSRQTLNVRGTSKLGEKMTFDAKLTYTRSEVENRPELAEGGANVVQTLNVLPRNISLASLRNNTVDELGNELKWTMDNTFSNPYWILENKYNKDLKNRLQGMVTMNWDFATNLKLMVRSGLDFSNKNTKNWENPGRPSIDAGKGSIGQDMSNGLEWNSDFLVTYDKQFTDINISLSGGGNYRYNQGNGISQWGDVIRVPDFYNIKNLENYWTSEGFSQKAVYSAYGLGTISYKNYIYLDVTYRNDWSSTLPSGNNSYDYHSENLSFLFTEAFGLNLPWLSMGKLRASYAKVGNDTDPYKIDQYYGISQTKTEYPMASMSSQLPNFHLKPEITRSWEVGTNLSFLQNKLVFDATYYYSVSSDQIMPVKLAPSTGYANRFTNAGKIQNTGIELQLDASPVSTASGFTWDFSLTWSKNNSLVKELYEDTPKLELASEFHMTVEAHPGQPFGVFYVTDYLRDENGNKLINGEIDSDEKGLTIQGEKKAMGDINPDWMAGFSNQLKYKNLRLSFLIDMQKGGQVYSWGKSYRALFGTGAETLAGRAEWYKTHEGFMYTKEKPGVFPEGYIEDGILATQNEDGTWTSTGVKNDIPVQPTYRWYNFYKNQIGTEWLLDATNIRLRELVLGYSIPSSTLKNLPISNIDISLVGRNLFFFYNAMGDMDPESGFNSGNTGTAIEHMSLPSTSSYGVNLKINF